MWPKSSLSSSSADSAPQWIATKGAVRRALWACRARATSSLPVPVGPSTSTLTWVGATRRTSARSCTVAAAWPTRPMSSRPCASSACPARSAASSPSRRALCSPRATTKRSMSGSMGLVRKSQAPSSVARRASAWSPWPVSTTTGTGAKRGISSSPISGSMCGGMARSSKTSSGRRWAKAARACAPSPASVTSWPRLRKKAPPRRWKAASSSTSSTWPWPGALVRPGSPPASTFCAARGADGSLKDGFMGRASGESSA